MQGINICGSSCRSMPRVAFFCTRRFPRPGLAAPSGLGASNRPAPAERRRIWRTTTTGLPATFRRSSASDECGPPLGGWRAPEGRATPERRSRWMLPAAGSRSRADTRLSGRGGPMSHPTFPPTPSPSSPTAPPASASPPPYASPVWYSEGPRRRSRRGPCRPRRRRVGRPAVPPASWPWSVNRAARPRHRLEHLVPLAGGKCLQWAQSGHGRRWPEERTRCAGGALRGEVEVESRAVALALSGLRRGQSIRAPSTKEPER